jgi:hypothetical protein
MLAIRDSKGDKRTGLRASRGQCAAPLICASVEFDESQGLCSAVGGHRNQGPLVTELLGELV